jgi:hypothetical protein
VIAVPFEEEHLETADLVVTFFEKSLQYLEMNLVDKILVPGVSRKGEILGKQDVLQQAYELGEKLATGSRGKPSRTGRKLTMKPDTSDDKRTILAPKSSPPNQPGIISVTLAPDEEVDWHWKYGPDGSRVVTGYTIRKKSGDGKSPKEAG